MHKNFDEILQKTKVARWGLKTRLLVPFLTLIPNFDSKKISK